MEWIPRSLNLEPLLQKKSCFLLGPRQTGKTAWIQKHLGKYRYYNLLKSDIFLKLSRHPERLAQEIRPDEKLVIIDEIQRLPILLNEVQMLLDNSDTHFLLTGSSARKLRQKGVNLLGGRARVRYLHPLTYGELGEHFDLERALSVGSLPSIYFSEDPYDDLEAYVGTYLTEEIAAEAVTRNVPAFSRFLTIAGISNGMILNYNKISSDAEVPKSTVQEYFQILRDTLVGYDLPAWKETIKRKPSTTSKFYLFDVGVAHYLQKQRHLSPHTPAFGQAFEAWIFHELRTYGDYHGKKELFHWRSQKHHEVDFIFEEVAIEVKAKSSLTANDLKGIKALKEEGLLKRYIVVTLEDAERVVDDIELLPMASFLQKLWSSEIT